MKIAIDAREMVGQIAGKGRYVAELVKELGQLDRANEYILYSKQPIEIALPSNMVNVIIGGLPGLRQPWLAWDAYRRGCQLLLAPTGYLPVIFSLIPSIVTIHDLTVFVSPYTKPAFKTWLAEKLLLGLAVKRAKAIISVSQSTKDDLIRLFHVPEDKITVTLLGYDKALYTPTATDDKQVLNTYNLTKEYLLFIGTLEPRKNIEGIIRAYAALSADLQARYPLVIGGKKGWFYDTIFTTVKELDLEKKVHFLGRVPDEHLPALYRQAKLFLFPSFYEGFGLPPLEAMACGTPAISSNISSLPEVVGQAGLLVEPTNINELTKAIEQLLTDKKIYDELKELSTKQASRFSWEQTAQGTLNVFKGFENEK